MRLKLCVPGNGVGVYGRMAHLMSSGQARQPAMTMRARAGQLRSLGVLRCNYPKL